MFKRLIDTLKKRNFKDDLEAHEASAVISNVIPAEKLTFKEALSFVLDKNGVNALNDRRTLYILSDICDFGKYSALKSILSESIRYNLFSNIGRLIGPQAIFQNLTRIKLKLIQDMGFDYIMVNYFLNTISNILIGSDSPESLEADFVKNKFLKENPSPDLETASHKQENTLHIQFLGCQLGCSTGQMLMALTHKGFLHTGFSYDKTRPELTGEFAGIPNCKIYIYSTPVSNKVWKIEIIIRANIGLIKEIYGKKYTIEKLDFSANNFKCRITGGEIQVRENNSNSTSISYEDSDTFQLRQKERNAKRIREQEAEAAARKKIIDNLNIDDI